MSPVRISSAFVDYELSPRTRPDRGSLPVRLRGRQAARAHLSALVRRPAGRRRLAHLAVSTGASPDVVLDRLAAWLAVGALELRRCPAPRRDRTEVEDAGTIVDLADLARG